MRFRFALAAAILLISVLGFGRFDRSSPATAQTAAPPILLYNEIETWCETQCRADYVDTSDGYVRVILYRPTAERGPVEGEGEIGMPTAAVHCEDMEIPEGVDGWAYIFDFDLDRFEVKSIADVRANPDIGPVCELLVKRST